MSSTPTPYRLSFNSPRASPFRRPSSPLTHSPSAARVHTPTSSPLKPATPSNNISPERAHSPLRNPTVGAPIDDSVVGAPHQPPSWRTTRGTTAPPEIPSSPTRNTPIPNPVPRPLFAPQSGPPVAAPTAPRHTRPTSSDPLSKLSPQLLHTLRESFSVLDHNNTGSVGAPEIADMLTQLGLDSSPNTLSAYFSDSPSMALSTYLQTLSSLLAPLSSNQELLAAFEAFDGDDSGQIDMAELKDALLNTAPEGGERKLTEREIDRVVDGFSGRRAFGKGKGKVAGGRGEVFRYNEFVASISGGGATEGQAAGGGA